MGCNRLILSVLLLISLQGRADNGWVTVFTKDEITVYMREITGSDIREFKGICIIDVPADVVNNVLNDISGFIQWMPDCIVSKMIEKKSNDYLIIYQVIKMPWPLKNRDFIFETKILEERDEITRTIKAVNHNDYPPTAGCVRIVNMSGQWTLIRRDNNTRTLAIYQIRSDPAGNIPVSVANYTNKILPYETLKRIKLKVLKDNYID